MGQHYFFSNHLEKPHHLELDWKIKSNGSAMDLPQSLTIRIDILSHPCDLCTFRFFIIKFISSSVKVIFSILLLVLNSKESSWLLLIIGVH